MLKIMFALEDVTWWGERSRKTSQGMAEMFDGCFVLDELMGEGVFFTQTGFEEENLQ